MTAIKARIMENTDKRTHTITDGRISVSGPSPERKFAKALLGAGYDPERVLEIRRRETLVYVPTVLGAWDTVEKVNDAPKEAPGSA